MGRFEDWADASMDDPKNAQDIRRVSEIRDRLDTGTLPTSEEAYWLLKSAKGYFTLRDLSDRDFAWSRAQILTKDLEIAELTRQLEEKK